MQKLVVLCVDDEKIILNSLRSELDSEIVGSGLSLELAESGEEALEIADELDEENGRIAVILSDQIMPQLKGDELLIQLHKRSPATVKILLTGQADADAVGRALNQAKLFRYISKPWEKNDLKMTVKAAMEKYKSDQQLKEQKELIDNLKANVIENFMTSPVSEDENEEELYNQVFFSRFLNSLEPHVQKWVALATVGLVCADTKITGIEMGYINALVTVNREKDYVQQIVKFLKSKEIPELERLRLPVKQAIDILNYMIRIVVSGGRLTKGEEQQLVRIANKMGIESQHIKMLLPFAKNDIQSTNERKRILESLKNISLASFD
ncbi:MAG: response regulator [SAR324 cluster bacterium]|nr:response regulator [SAR324 cluster bacterium]